jgi:hypothetical protein
MAQNFYSLKETCDKLRMTEDQVKELVRNAQLREFRDAGKVNYKVEDVDKLVESLGVGGPAGSGELVLEPADEESAVGLSGSGIDLVDSTPGLSSDALSLEEADDTAAGTKAEGEKKDDTVVTSVGVSVFDEDEEELLDVDPLAQTVVSAGAEGLGIEGAGSGSGLLDLTRESDDTSLGADLLDEIYPEEESVEMGDATRAGLEQAIPESGQEGGSGAEPVVEAEEVTAEAAAAPAVRTRTVVEYGPDAVSMGLTGMLVVATAVMCVAGVGAASMMQGVWPSLLRALYENLWIFGAVSLVVALGALGLGFVLGRRSAG